MEAPATPPATPVPIAAVQIPDDAVGAFLSGARGNPDDQVLACIVEAQALRLTFARISRDVRGPFKWRCAGMASVIEDGLAKYFGDAVGDGER